jgi:hypothetical protein
MYRLSVPHMGFLWVIVSAVTLERQDDPTRQAICELASAMAGLKNTGHETFIFGCDACGDYEGLDALPGSFQGRKDHHRALENAGFAVEEACCG